MSSRKYSEINGNGLKLEIEVRWRILWRNIEVRVNGTQVGRFESKKELNAGKTFPLSSGDQLMVRFDKNSWPPDLDVHLNGRAVKGSKSDPETKIKAAYYTVVFLCLINFIVFVLAEFLHVQELLKWGYGKYNFFMGCGHLLCLIFGWKNKSFHMLLVASLLFGLDTCLAFYGMYSGWWGAPASSSFVGRFMFGAILVNGLKARFDDSDTAVSDSDPNF